MTPLVTPIFDFHSDGSALTTPTPTPSLMKTSLKIVCQLELSEQFLSEVVATRNQEHVFLILDVILVSSR